MWKWRNYNCGHVPTCHVLTCPHCCLPRVHGSRELWCCTGPALAGAGWWPQPTSIQFLCFPRQLHGNVTTTIRCKHPVYRSVKHSELEPGHHITVEIICSARLKVTSHRSLQVTHRALSSESRADQTQMSDNTTTTCLIKILQVVCSEQYINSFIEEERLSSKVKEFVESLPHIKYKTFKSIK